MAESGNTTLVVFFNFNETDGTTTDTYYIDDLFFGPADIEETMCEDPIITDFECDLPSHPITGDLTTIINPFIEGSNTSANVGEYTDNGTETFDNIAVNYTTPIDLTTNNKLRVKIYTTQTTNLLVKLEGGTSEPVELGNVGDAGDNIDVINAWKEYEFDFSDQAGENHERLVLFFNAGNEQPDPEIFFIDDLRWDSESLSVSEVAENTTFSVYPNPSDNMINIKSITQVIDFEIYDLSGKCVLKNNRENINISAINISTLSTGIYFLTLRSSSISQTIKVVKK